MIISKSNLISIYLLFLIHNEIFILYIFLTAILGHFKWLGGLSIKCEALSYYDTFINLAANAIFLIQYPVDKPDHLFFDFG